MIRISQSADGVAWIKEHKMANDELTSVEVARGACITMGAASGILSIECNIRQTLKPLRKEGRVIVYSISPKFFTINRENRCAPSSYTRNRKSREHQNRVKIENTYEVTLVDRLLEFVGAVEELQTAAKTVDLTTIPETELWREIRRRRELQEAGITWRSKENTNRSKENTNCSKNQEQQ